MTDLDQSTLCGLVLDETRHGLHSGQVCVAVPLDLLERVTRDFDCAHVHEQRESRFGR